MAFSAETSPELQGHVQSCEYCQAELAWVQKYPLAGRLTLAEPPMAWAEKAIDLANPVRGAVERLRKLVGKLVFDSWVLPLPVTARGLPMENRRLRFEAENILLDIRAEKRPGGWSFVAQATSPTGWARELHAGRKRLMPDANGVFQWTDRQPPRRVALHIDDTVLEVPELTWNMPRKS